MKPIKSENRWCSVLPNGTMVLYTLCPTKTESIAELIKHRLGESNWNYLRRIGYRCVQVKIEQIEPELREIN